MEITYLAQRIKNGVEVNNLNKEKLIFSLSDGNERSFHVDEELFI